MGGLFGAEIEFRSRGLQLPYSHNEALEPRTGKLAFGIPYEILLGMLCHSNANADRAAEFFLTLADQDSSAVARYLSGFIARLIAECDLNAGDLKVRPEAQHTPMDFPRPSPARVLVWQFAKRLSTDRALYSELSRVSGAPWFFYEVVTNSHSARA